MTKAAFHILGTIPTCKEHLKIMERDVTRLSAQFIINIGKISSSPLDLVASIDLSNLISLSGQIYIIYVYKNKSILLA